MLCSKITSVDIIAFAQSLKVKPQTVQNYLSHLGAVFAIAKPAWGYPLDRQAIKDAMVVAKKLGVTSKGNSRDRRPTLDELDRLMVHFGKSKRAVRVRADEKNNFLCDLLDTSPGGNHADHMG